MTVAFMCVKICIFLPKKSNTTRAVFTPEDISSFRKRLYYLEAYLEL